MYILESASRMRAYVVNLDSRPERWRQIQTRFKRSSVKLRRFPAIEHESGGLGNALSVLKVLKMAKKEKLHNVLLLEDDCLPAPGWEENWKAVRHWLDTHEDEWDLYVGGAWGGNNLFQDLTDFFGVGPTEVGHVGKNILFKYPFVTLGGHWVYYNHKSYTNLITYYERLIAIRKTALDVPWMNLDCHHMAFRTISSYPFIAYQKSAYSNVSEEFVDREKLIKGYEKRVGRHLTRKHGRTTRSITNV